MCVCVCVCVCVFVCLSVNVCVCVCVRVWGWGTYMPSAFPTADMCSNVVWPLLLCKRVVALLGAHIMVRSSKFAGGCSGLFGPLQVVAAWLAQRIPLAACPAGPLSIPSLLGLEGL